MVDIFRSNDVLKGTRCYTHAVWDLPVDADWTDVLERAVNLVGSDNDIEMDDAVEWNVWWERAAR